MAILGISLIGSPVSADAAPPPDPSLGSAAPYQPIRTMVQMVSETVYIDIPTVDANNIHVNASFLMRNQGSNEEKMQVIFPLTNLHAPYWYESLYKIEGSSFHATVNGEEHTISFISTPPELTSSEPNPWDAPEGKYIEDVGWAAFEAAFPVKQDVLLEINYDMVGFEFGAIEYIIETGAGWYGNIQSADIRMHLPYPVEEGVIEWANPGYFLTGNEICWKLTNFEPTRNDNFRISIVNPNKWLRLQEDQKKAEQVQNDAQLWYDLGESYSHTKTYINDWPNPYQSFNGFANQYMAKRAAEAFEKSIQLRPDWGNSHWWLVHALWYGRDSKNLSSTDPLVKRIQQELDFAWKSNSDHEYLKGSEGGLIWAMNTTIPGLDLPIPFKNSEEIITFTPVYTTPTPTPTFTLTRTPSLTRTSTSTLTPLPSATLAPSFTPTVEMKTRGGTGWVGGIAAGIIFVLGGVIFLWGRYRRQIK